MTKNDFAFGRDNFILIAVSVAIITIGFLLMSGGGIPQDGVSFNPEIFDARRIVVAPVVTMAGFGLMVFAILKNSKENKNEE
jgi:NhaP-type Na+/H+ or K+/H+ antiporter